MTLPVGHSHASAPTAVPDDKKRKNVENAAHTIDLPPFLEYVSDLRAELFRNLCECEVVDAEGKVCVDIELPELQPNEIEKLKEKVFTPLFGNKSVKELLNEFSGNFSGVHLFGSSVFYFLFYELPDYRNRLFKKIDGFPVEELAKLTPISHPIDRDIAIDLKDENGENNFTKEMLTEASNRFLATSGAVLKKNDPVDKGYIQYYTRSTLNSEIEFSLRGQMACQHLFSTSNLYLPLLGLFLDRNEPLRPLSFSGHALQAIIDGALGIIRSEDNHFIRYISQITRGGSPAKRVALNLDRVRCNKTVGALIDEIQKCLQSHHGTDPFETFAYLFNFCQFWEVDDKKKRVIWDEFYKIQKHPKPTDIWAQNCIDFLIEEQVPFSHISSLLHHAFLLSHTSQKRSEVKVDINHYQFKLPLLKGQVRGACLQIPYSSKTTLPIDVNLLQLLDQIIPRDNQASPSLKLFKHQGKPSQWSLCASLLAENPVDRLASILKAAKGVEGSDLDLAMALTLLLTIKERGLETFEKPQSVISLGIVFLVTKVKDPLLAEWLMEKGSARGLIKHRSREQTIGWLTLLHSQLCQDNAEAIFQRWKELKELKEINSHKGNKKSVEFLLQLSKFLKERDELLDELRYLEIPEKYARSAETFFREQLMQRAGKNGFSKLPLTILKSEVSHQMVVRQCIVSSALGEAVEAFHHFATHYPQSNALFEFFDTLLKKALDQKNLHLVGDFLATSTLQGMTKSKLLQKFLEASFELKQDQRWALSTQPLKLFLQSEFCPGLATIVISVLEELPLPKAPYRPLKPQLTALLPDLLNLLIREDQNQLAFKLVCAGDLAEVISKWNFEWTYLLKNVLKGDITRLTRVTDIARRYKINDPDLWVTLGRSWLLKRSIENVDVCLKKLNGKEDLTLLDKAISLYVEQEKYERAVPLLQRSKAIHSTQPSSTNDDFRIKRREMVKKCIQRLFTENSSEKKLRGCDLLISFADEFLEGEETLWMTLMNTLSQLNPSKLWLTLSSVVESKKILEGHKLLREEAWVMALNSLHRERFFQWTLTSQPLPFPFAPSQELKERLFSRILEEAQATKNHQSREDVFSYLVPRLLEGDESVIFDRAKCQLITALLHSQKSERQECGMTHLKQLLTNPKRLSHPLLTLIQPLTSLPPQKALSALIPLSNSIVSQKRKECDIRALLKYWIRCEKELELTSEQYKPFLELVFVAFGEKWIKKDSESCALLQQVIERSFIALRSFPSLRENTGVIIHSAWVANYLPHKMFFKYKSLHLFLWVTEGILSTSLTEQLTLFESLVTQFEQGINFQEKEEKIINSLCDLLIQWSQTEEEKFFLPKIYSFLTSLQSSPVSLARYRPWITKVCALPHTTKHFKVLIQTVGTAIETCNARSPKEEEPYLSMLELFIRVQLTFRGSLNELENGELPVTCLLEKVDPKYIKPGSIILYLYYSMVYLKKGNPPFPNEAELFASYIETYVRTLLEGLDENRFRTLLGFLDRNKLQLLDCALKSRNDDYYLRPFQLVIESCFSRAEPLGKLSLLNLSMYTGPTFFAVNLKDPQASNKIKQRVTQQTSDKRRLQGKFRLMFFELMCNHLLPPDLTQFVSEETLSFLIGFNRNNIEHGWLDEDAPQIKNNERRLSTYEAPFLARTGRSSHSPDPCHCLKYGKEYSLTFTAR